MVVVGLIRLLRQLGFCALATLLGALNAGLVGFGSEGAARILGGGGSFLGEN